MPGKDREQVGSCHLSGVVRRIQQSKGLDHHSHWHGALLQQVTTIGYHAQSAAHEAGVSVASVSYNETGLCGGGVGILIAGCAVHLWGIALG